jgi:hypothetical protein
MLQVLHLDVLKVDQVLHLSSRLLLPASFSDYRAGTVRADRGGAPGNGNADVSACSLLPLRRQVALRFTFSVIRGDDKIECSR